MDLNRRIEVGSSVQVEKLVLDRSQRVHPQIIKKKVKYVVINADCQEDEVAEVGGVNNDCFHFAVP